VALGDDLVTDRCIQGADEVLQQQGARIALAECADHELGEPGQDLIAHPRARGAHDRDPLGEETTSHEPEDLGGDYVEPLRILDDADERLFLCDLRE
jgi:hypothetical protein